MSMTDLPNPLTLDRDESVSSWTTVDEADTDTGIRRYDAATAILESFRMPSTPYNRAKAVEAAKAAEEAYSNIVQMTYWLPHTIVNHMDIRQVHIKGLVRDLMNGVSEQGLVPLSLPVLTIKCFPRPMIGLPEDGFEEIVSVGPEYDPREHIATRDGYEYMLHVSVRARKVVR